MYVKRAVIKWLSRTVLRTSSDHVKLMFHELEKLHLKLVSLKSHRTFNETCLSNDLLLAYKNIYIYIQELTLNKKNIRKDVIQDNKI